MPGRANLTTLTAMKNKLTRFALLALALACFSPAAMAGPGSIPMLWMYQGQMYVITPMTKDMMLKSGTKVGMNGMVTMKSGKTMKLTDGAMMTASGKIMAPSAIHGHGG